MAHLAYITRYSTQGLAGWMDLGYEARYLVPCVGPSCDATLMVHAAVHPSIHPCALSVVVVMGKHPLWAWPDDGCHLRGATMGGMGGSADEFTGCRRARPTAPQTDGVRG